MKLEIVVYEVGYVFWISLLSSYVRVLYVEYLVVIMNLKE